MASSRTVYVPTLQRCADCSCEVVPADACIIGGPCLSTCDLRKSVLGISTGQLLIGGGFAGFWTYHWIDKTRQYADSNAGQRPNGLFYGAWVSCAPFYATARGWQCPDMRVTGCSGRCHLVIKAYKWMHSCMSAFVRGRAWEGGGLVKHKRTCAASGQHDRVRMWVCTQCSCCTTWWCGGRSSRQGPLASPSHAPRQPSCRTSRSECPILSIWPLGR